MGFSLIFLLAWKCVGGFWYHENLFKAISSVAWPQYPPSSCALIWVALFLFYRPGTQSTVAAQAAPTTNPFGTLPTMPQVSIGRTGTSPSVQYGISSLPVSILTLNLSKIESMHDVFEHFEDICKNVSNMSYFQTGCWKTSSCENIIPFNISAPFPKAYKAPS